MLKNHSPANYPRVSIVILTYNGSRYIKALIDSLLNQSYPEDLMQIIVVDNASGDNTRTLVRKLFPSVKLVALKENTGFAAGNNHGLKYAQHDFIAFLNQDTICHRDWLVCLMDAMLEKDQIAACNSNIIPTKDNEPIDLISPVEQLFFCDLSFWGYGRFLSVNKQMVSSRLLSGCAFVIRRSVLNKLTYLFDEQFWMYAEDTDLSLRILNLGLGIRVVRDSIVFHLHKTNAKIGINRLSVIAKAIKNRVYAFYKNMGLFEFLLYFPVLLLGGFFKILEFDIKPIKKTILFIPFGLYSAGCMLFALFGVSKFFPKKEYIICNRRVEGFTIFKALLPDKFK